MSESTSPYSRRQRRLPPGAGASSPPLAAGPGDTIRNPSTRTPVAPSGLSRRLASAGQARGPGQAGGAGRGRGYLLAAVLGAALLVVGGRVLHDSWAALRAGDAALGQGQRGVATREYLHAVRMYLPGSPFVARALGRLEEVARDAASAGDLGTERRAWEAVRAGLLGARWLRTPHPDRLAAANRRLATLYAQIEEERVAPGATIAQRERWHAERLRQPPGPAVPATLAALLGLGLWLGAVVVFIRRGVDRSLRLERRWAVCCAVGFFVGFSLFVLGLRLA